MKQQVEEFLANLLSMGMKQDQAVEQGYKFALALLQANEEVGASISATTMFRASEMVKDAIPGAYRIYQLRNRIR